MADNWIEDEVARCGEMNPRLGLRIHYALDGDITLTIEENGIPLRLKDGCFATVEFCKIGSGGGESPNVRKALMALMTAMKEDNKNNPYGDRTDPKSYPKSWEEINAAESE